MTHSIVLLNDGTSGVLLNDGTSYVLLNAEGPEHVAVGSLSGRRKKKLGTQLDDTYAKPQKIVSASGESVARIKLSARNESKGRIKLRASGESKCIQIPHQKGESVSRIIYKTVNESVSRLYFKHTMESFAIPHPSVQMGRQIRLQKLSILKEIAEKVMSLERPSPLKEFSFNETIHNEQLIAFTHTSSWIGNVRYDTETLQLRILMNGKPYFHCGVPHRIFDAFAGAPSKGEFWWRNIREQYDC